MPSFMTDIIRNDEYIDKDSGYFYFIDIIKIIAIFLILNSHMEPVYSVSQLATGGALGNSLFFISSGYLLRGKKKDIHFFVKAILKLYIPLYIVLILTGMDMQKHLFYQLIWPTNFWFIGAIILFYFLYALLEKINVYEYFSIFLIIMGAFYFSVYYFVLDTSLWVVEKAGLYDIESAFKLIYYFVIMMIGGKVKDSNKRGSSRMWLLISIGSVFAMYSFKYAMDKGVLSMNMQFTSQLFTLIFAVATLNLFENVEAFMNIKNKGLIYVIKLLSRSSLSIYLVQFICISQAAKIETYISIPIAFVSSVLIGIALSEVSLFICKNMYKIIPCSRRY